MTNRRLSQFLCFLLVGGTALTGCAQSSQSFPSLMPRAIEQRSDDPVVPAPIVIEPDPVLDAVIAKAEADLTAATAHFDTKAASAAKRVGKARGAPAGSETWLTAQTALAELDVARAATSQLASDLDQQVIDRGVTGAPPYPPLEAIVAKARTDLDRERTRIAEIEGQLRRP